MEENIKQKTTTVGLNTDEVRKICRGTGSKDSTAQMLCVVEEELTQGFEFVKKYHPIITVLGSARTKADDRYYQHAVSIASRLVSELSAAVVTGGGPGIMEAANKGAKEADGHSLSMNIELVHEQGTNPYVTEGMNFHFFFTRKVIMVYASHGFIFFPGGFGTLNEFFEMVTLMQTHKMQPAPLVLFGRDFWEPLQGFIENHLREGGFIDPSDMELLYIITDDEDEVLSTLARHLGK